MSSPPALHGLIRKHDWAKNHFKNIRSVFESHMASIFSGQGEVIVETQPEREELIIRPQNFKPLDDSFPLMIGDCVHNLRSALDHLVYQLAVLRGTPEANWREKISFPIFLNQKMFIDVANKKVKPYISAEALAQIERSQPYFTANPSTDPPLMEKHALWVLSQLDIIDKHRLILVVYAATGATGYSFVTTQPLTIHEPRLNEWRPMENGTEILKLNIRGLDAPGKMNVKFQFASDILFTNTGLFCDGKSIFDTLNSLIITTRDLIDEFEKLFFR